MLVDVVNRWLCSGTRSSQQIEEIINNLAGWMKENYALEDELSFADADSSSPAQPGNLTTKQTVELILLNSAYRAALDM